MRTFLRSSVAAIAAAAALQGCGPSSSDPAAANGAVADHLSKGKAALELALGTHSTDAFLEAANEFSAAVAVIPADAAATTADKDAARFFGAFARVAVLADPYSDFVPDNGLNDLGDLLDGFGLGGTTAQRSNADTLDYQTCTQTCSGTAPYVYCWDTCELNTLSPTSPTSAQVQAFLFTKLSAGLDEAATLLEDVTSGFATTILDGGRTVELDYADVQFVKGLARAMMAEAYVQQAYDLDVDLDALAAKTGQYTEGDFLAEHPGFLRLKDAAVLPQAKAYAHAAVTSWQAAFTSLRAETDGQGDDLIRLSSESCTWDPVTHVSTCTTTYNPEAQLADFEKGLADAKGFLEASGDHTFDMGTPADPADDVVVNPGTFFAGIDLRAKIPASFTAGLYGDRPSLFPDPAFGGLVVTLPIDLNADLDGDGSPDFLDGYSQFFADYFVSTHLDIYAFGYVYGSVAFGATPGTFTFTAWSPAEAASGTYSFSGDVVTLTFDAPLTTGVKTVVIRGSLIQRASFEGYVECKDASGVVVNSTYNWFNRY